MSGDLYDTDYEETCNMKNNLVKLLPAVAVIAAVTVTGVLPEASEDKTEKNVSGAKTDVIEAKDLEGLLTTAYAL